MSDGLCMCGCGEATELARRTSTRRGWKKGEPLRYLRNHYHKGANVLKGRALSDEHKAALRGPRVSMRQSSHWNWKGGRTTENAQARHSSEYVNWRREVFERDNWTCQECGSTNTRLEAHHILSFSEYEALRYVVENGVTLCKPCHVRVERAVTFE